MLPSKMSSRKHKRSTVGDSLPPAKRESRTGTKRPHPSDDEDYGTEEEHELTQLQSQDLKEGVLSFVSYPLCSSMSLHNCIVLNV